MAQCPNAPMPNAQRQCPIGERLASRDREGMRFEFKVPHAEEPFAHSGVVDDELLLGMVKLLLLNSALQLRRAAGTLTWKTPLLSTPL